MQKPQKKGKAQRKDDDRLASPPVGRGDLKPPARGVRSRSLLA